MIVITSANLLRAIWMPNEICNARAATPAPKRDEKTLRPEPRMVRLVSRFLAAVLIGVGLTLAGQSYGEQLNDMIMGWAPSLAWLLPAQSPKKTAEGAVSSDVAQQIKLIAVDLASVRRNMGQLAANQDQFAAKQEQMNQSIATGSRSSKMSDSKLLHRLHPSRRILRRTIHRNHPRAERMRLRAFCRYDRTYSTDVRQLMRGCRTEAALSSAALSPGGRQTHSIAAKMM
jgi:hypothetical protein